MSGPAKPAPLWAIALLTLPLVFMLGSGLGLALTSFFVSESYAMDTCGQGIADVRTRFVIAWAHVHAGEPLDDMDLQAFSDANDVLICLENQRR